MFKKAERKSAFLKIAMQGPTGSGKTWSALLLAAGFGGKIAVLDTENGSASLYSDKFDFDTLEMHAPFLTEKYITGIKEAEKAGYDILIIDSLSHAWAAEGGILDQKSAKDARGGNSYTNWAEFTKKHESLKAAILQSKLHVIITMRSKMEYVLEADSNGKQRPKKVGMAAVQRDDMPYEFTVLFEIAQDHSYEATKDRTGLFDGHITKITRETGKRLREWLEVAPKLEASQVGIEQELR